MRIAVMAAGAVGGYFGARLAAAGHDVTFIARGAHRDAIRREGLKIESALGDLHLKDVNVTDDPTQAGPADVVLFAAQFWDTETEGDHARRPRRRRSIRGKALGYRDGRRTDAPARRLQHPRDYAAERRRQRRAARSDP